jgi:hypothetical protein
VFAPRAVVVFEMDVDNVRPERLDGASDTPFQVRVPHIEAHPQTGTPY